MTIRDLTAVIERFAAPELQEEWDNSGLLVGAPDAPCTGVLCCLDVTLEVLAEAADRGCNLVLAHHPIILKGLRRLNGKHYTEAVVMEAVRRGIAIFAAHTNLDNILLGVNGELAAQLGLEDCRILAPKKGVLRRLITFAPEKDAEAVRQALFSAGAGEIGKYGECSFNSRGHSTFTARPGADPYVGEIGKRHEEAEVKIETVYPAYLEPQMVRALEEAHPYEEVAYDIFTMNNVHWGIGSGLVGTLPRPVEEEGFLQRLKEVFGLPVVRHSRLRGKPVQRVAVCGGAGAFLTGAALGAGADVFLTADLKYHEFFEGNGRLLLADIGHYEGERFAADLLQRLLLEKFPTFAVLKTGLSTNSVHYS